MRLGRRHPFGELVTTQLALFADDESELLREAVEAEEAWMRAGRDTAEEAYGDYQLVVDAIADRLLDVREAYAATLADDAVVAYRRAFWSGAAKRFRRYASLVADLEP
jgi:sirohydrochlorin ferrochelatase